MREEEMCLPYPVSSNRYWRTAVIGRSVRTYLSAEAKAYREKVKSVARDLVPFDGGVALTVLVAPKITKKRVASKVLIDLDNALKVTIDALNGIAFHDDNQVKSIHAAYCAPQRDGGLYISISPMPNV